MKHVCIYHGNCADGFGAAWVVRKRLLINGIKEEDIAFHAGVYSEPPPPLFNKDTNVIIVDFSYPHTVMDEIAKTAYKLTWIDHHKTAGIDMKEAKEEIDGIFSEARSGAYLAWQYFFGNQFNDDGMPQLIKHIDDRDRWEFKLPGTREIQANLFSYPYDFKVWDRLMEMTSDQLEHDFAVGGEAIERKHFKDIHELLGLTALQTRIGPYEVIVANMPYTMASDAGNILCKQHATCDFAIIWYLKSNKRYYLSLRSVGDFDVSAIAKKLGGGGHKNAAGAEVDSFEEMIYKIEQE